MQLLQSELGILADKDVESIKSDRRRDLLPVRVPKNREDVRTEGYSPVDVVAVAIAEHLKRNFGGEHGLAPRAAASIASSSRATIVAAFNGKAIPDQWAGVVASRFARDGRIGKRVIRWCVSGSLQHVADEIARVTADSDSAAVRVFLINVSDVIRDVRERARAHHIFFPDILEAIAA